MATQFTPSTEFPASFNRAELVFNVAGEPIDVRIREADANLTRLVGLPIDRLNGILLSNLFSHMGHGEAIMHRLVARENFQTYFYCEYLGFEVLFTSFFDNSNELLLIISKPEPANAHDKPADSKSDNLSLRVFFESTYNWEYWLAPDGSVKMMSPSCYRITGYTAEEFLTNSSLLKEIVHPSDQHIVNPASKDKHDFEIRIIHRNGEIRWIKHVCLPVFSNQGEFLGRRVSNSDITELKYAYAELEESRRRLQTLFSNLPGMVYRCKNDPNWTMEFISQGALELTGYPPEVFINNNRLSFNDIIHPDHRERLWNKWQDLLARHETFYDEYPIVTASGELKWVLERGCGVFDENGNLLALEGFIWDNTPYHQILEDLTAKAKELETANSMKDKLLSIIAHDLKNPLGNLIGYTELLLEDYSTLDDAERLEMIKHIHLAASMTDHLITNLLDWSRLKNGRYQPSPVLIDLSALISEIIILNRNIAHQKNIRLISLIPPATYIHTDHYAISTILRNLISNALKFAFPGKSVKISVNEIVTGLLSIDVVDEGITLSDDEIANILSPHSIASKIGTSGEKGTGMGLKLSMEFAAMIGGRLQAKPRKDKTGMVFSLIFPKNLNLTF
ncbi:MAG: PAS domain-containing sensor histidine kinase [Bacteroidales bacterium]